MLKDVVDSFPAEISPLGPLGDVRPGGHGPKAVRLEAGVMPSVAVDRASQSRSFMTVDQPVSAICLCWGVGGL